MSKQKVKVPDSLRDVLLEFSIAYLLEQPGDVIDFAVDFFTKLQSNRAQTGIGIGITKPSTPDESIISQDEGESSPPQLMQIACKSCGSSRTLFNLVLVLRSFFFSWIIVFIFAFSTPTQSLLWIALRVDESLYLLNSMILKKTKRTRTTKLFSLRPMNSVRDYPTRWRTFYCSVHLTQSR